MIDKIKDAFRSFGGSEPDRPEPDEEMQEAIEEREEQIEELQSEREELQQKLESGDEERAARLGQMEDEIQELQQEKKELQQQLQQLQQQNRELQQEDEAATTTLSAPDSEYLKERPVISARGDEFFGLFGEWINQRNKMGIKAVDPHNPDEAIKVGMAETLDDLVVDARNLMSKDVIVVKLDGDMQKIEPYAPPGRLQEMIQKYEQAKDKANRLSSENSTLIDQKAELKDQRDKAITAASRLRMKLAEQQSPAREMTVGKLHAENQKLKEETDNRTEMLKHTRGETSEVIEQEEQARQQLADEVGKADIEEAFDQVGEAADMTMRQLERMLSGLPENEKQEYLEAFMDNLAGDSGGEEVSTNVEEGE